MKAMNFQDDISSLPIGDFQLQHLLMTDLTSMQLATKLCKIPELIGEPLKLQLNFTFPLEHVTELIALGEQMYSVAVDKCVVAGKK